MDNFKGYGLFNDVEDKVLRTWNRCQTFLNIKEQHGEELAKEYLNKFDPLEQLFMMATFTSISMKGMESVRMEVQEHVNCLEL